MAGTCSFAFAAANASSVFNVYVFNIIIRLTIIFKNVKINYNRYCRG
jgi:hypothetical protein